MSAPDPWVAEHGDRIPAAGEVLDLACGAGRHTRWLLARGYGVTAADIDMSRLAPPSHPRLRCMAYDFEAGPWPFVPARFDGIVVCNYLHRPLLPALVHALRPGGVLLYTTFMVGNERFGRPRNPDYLLRVDELTRAFAQLEVLAFAQGESGPAVRQSIVARQSDG